MSNDNIPDWINCDFGPRNINKDLDVNIGGLYHLYAQHLVAELYPDGLNEAQAAKLSAQLKRSGNTPMGEGTVYKYPRTRRFDPIEFAQKRTDAAPTEGSGPHLQLVFKDGQMVERVGGGIITLDDVRQAMDGLNALQEQMEPNKGSGGSPDHNVGRVFDLSQRRDGRFTLPPEG